jgi:hypothetical protein
MEHGVYPIIKVACEQARAAERSIGWNEGREHERKCNEAALAAEREKPRITQKRNQKPIIDAALAKVKDAEREERK